MANAPLCGMSADPIGESLAETLNGDRRRGRVCARMTSTHPLLAEADAAAASGTRALAIAGVLGGGGRVGETRMKRGSVGLLVAVARAVAPAGVAALGIASLQWRGPASRWPLCGSTTWPRRAQPFVLPDSSRRA